jgi:hypothetical protein
MSESIIIKKMNKLMADTEISPDVNDNSLWVKMKGDTYSVLKKIIKIEYTIDDNIIKDMTEYNKLYNELKDKMKLKDPTQKDVDITKALNDKIKQKKPKQKDADIVWKIYVITDAKGNHITSSTTNSILTAVKINVHRYLLEKNKSNLKDFEQLSGMKVRIIGSIKGIKQTARKKLTKLKEYFEMKYLIENESD